MLSWSHMLVHPKIMPKFSTVTAYKESQHIWYPRSLNPSWSMPQPTDVKGKWAEQVSSLLVGMSISSHFYREYHMHIVNSPINANFEQSNPFTWLHVHGSIGTSDLQNKSTTITLWLFEIKKETK